MSAADIVRELEGEREMTLQTKRRKGHSEEEEEKERTLG